MQRDQGDEEERRRECREEKERRKRSRKASAEKEQPPTQPPPPHVMSPARVRFCCSMMCLVAPQTKAMPWVSVASVTWA